MTEVVIILPDLKWLHDICWWLILGFPLGAALDLLAAWVCKYFKHHAWKVYLISGLVKLLGGGH